MKKSYRQIHTFAAIGITAAFVLTTCTACSKENKTVPTMATVSSLSSDVGASSIADSVTSSAVSSAASSSSSSAVSKASSSSSTASKSASSSTTKKPSGGSTAKPSVGGSTTKPSGGTTGGSTTKPSGGSTGGGTVTPAPQPSGIQTVGYASKYGCNSQDQYNYVRQKASAVGYSQGDFNQAKDAWSQLYSVPYSDSLNAAMNLAGSAPNTSGSSENAYDVFARHNGSCTGRSRAKAAILQTHGYNAKVVYGQNSGGANHAWVTFQCGGTWYSFDGELAQGNAPAGYHIDSISYQ